MQCNHTIMRNARQFRVCARCSARRNSAHSAENAGENGENCEQRIYAHGGPAHIFAHIPAKMRSNSPAFSACERSHREEPPAYCALTITAVAEGARYAADR